MTRPKKPGSRGCGSWPAGSSWCPRAHRSRTRLHRLTCGQVDWPWRRLWKAIGPPAMRTCWPVHAIGPTPDCRSCICGICQTRACSDTPRSACLGHRTTTMPAGWGVPCSGSVWSMLMRPPLGAARCDIPVGDGRGRHYDQRVVAIGHGRRQTRFVPGQRRRRGRYGRAGIRGALRIVDPTRPDPAEFAGCRGTRPRTQFQTYRIRHEARYGSHQAHDSLP